MSWTNTSETSLLQLVFQAASWANIADNATTTPATNLYVSLHTADPGEAGTQETNEATYTGYARQAVSRDASGWAVSAGQASNVADLVFPAATAGAETITYYGIGLASSGAGTLLARGQITTPLSGVAVSEGTQIKFVAGQLIFSED